MEFEEINSLQNGRVKQIVKWRERGPRDRDQVVLIEGYRALRRALEAEYPVDELYFCPELYQGENEEGLLREFVARGARLFRLGAAAFAKIAYRDRPEGLLGIGPQRRRGLKGLTIPPEKAFFLVAEQIEKPGNLGTMMRSADAVGVDGLILCDSRTDLYNPNVVRASTGNLFTLPIAEASSEEAIDWLKAAGLRILAASPHVEKLYFDVDMKGPLAIVVGSEQYGLSETWMQAADERLRLPMMGKADSLNVSTASALLLYECLRQRLVG
ncbi:MAG: RNA methyltransferase [Lentisphaerae bacterium]|nr:RNA methyltransferase [Lentisphaerota bacterium]